MKSEQEIREKLVSLEKNYELIKDLSTSKNIHDRISVQSVKRDIFILKWILNEHRTGILKYLNKKL